MGVKIWPGICFMIGSCFLVPAAAQEPGAVRCPPTLAAEAGAAGVEGKAGEAAPRTPQGCKPHRPVFADSDKALVVALLGCVVAFASHLARRRSTKVELS